MGVHRREQKGECKWEDTMEGGCHKGEYQRREISKSGDTKTIRWNSWGGAKVSMGVQRRCLEGA